MSTQESRSEAHRMVGYHFSGFDAYFPAYCRAVSAPCSESKGTICTVEGENMAR